MTEQTQSRRGSPEGAPVCVMTCARQPEPETLEAVRQGVCRLRGLPSVELKVELDPSLLGGCRMSQFGCEALVKDRHTFTRRYPGLTVEPASLEDIMIFTVKGDAQ